MLSIESKSIERTIEIGHLFDELSLEIEENAECQNDFDIEILSSNNTFQKIEAFRCSEKLQKLNVVLNDGKRLVAASDHLISSNDEWVYLKDLNVGQYVDCLEGPVKIKSITSDEKSEILFDLQVANSHCFYTNGILSHNSHILVQLGANALRLGKNVLHYTFELSEMAVGLRYDSNLTGIPSQDIIDNKEDVITHYENNDEYGRLIIKEYPTNYASSITIRNHIDKLTLKGFKPSVILIDYADIMRSTRQYDSLRHELKLIYEELRCLAGELNIPIWTASQANKESSNSDVVGLENMSEAYGKAMVCDFVLTLARKPMEKESGFGKMFIAKNRAGKDGIAFSIHLDTARSQLVVTDTEKMNLTEARLENENEYKRALRNTLRSVRKDSEVEIKRVDLREDDSKDDE